MRPTRNFTRSRTSASYVLGRLSANSRTPSIVAMAHRRYGGAPTTVRVSAAEARRSGELWLEFPDQLGHPGRRFDPQLMAQQVPEPTVVQERLSPVPLRQVGLDQHAVGALSEGFAR